jgi:DNA polymerase III epsilon subunit-like protein
VFGKLFARWRPPPQRRTVALDAPIDMVRIVALDCETTGLDPRRDRIVSLAALPIEGGECRDDRAIDRLIDPGRSIPERSTAVHGITDRDVAGAPAFATLYPELDAALADGVLLGHEIGFDAAMIRREAHLARLRWVTPPLLDTLLLFAATSPESNDLRLEAIAEKLGITIRGRHTALGDARAAAEIYLRLRPALAARGAATLGDLLALCHEQHRVLRLRMGPRW